MTSTIGKSIPDWRQAPAVRKIYKERAAMADPVTEAQARLVAAQTEADTARDALVELETMLEFGKSSTRAIEQARRRLDHARLALEEARAERAKAGKRREVRDRAHAELCEPSIRETAHEISKAWHARVARLVPLVEEMIPLAEELRELESLARAHCTGGDVLGREMRGFHAYAPPGTPLLLVPRLATIAALREWLRGTQDRAQRP